MLQIKNYLEPIQRIYELLRLSETPKGFFLHLASLMKALKKDPDYQYKFAQLMDTSNVENEEIQCIKEKVIDWMCQRLKLMREVKFASAPEVKKSLDNLEQILSGDIWEIRSGGCFDILSDYFYSACSSLARYGICSKCEDWLKIAIKKSDRIYYEDAIDAPKAKRLGHKKEQAKKSRTQIKKIKPSSKQGKLLISRLGHGFVSAVVLPSKLFFDHEGTTRTQFEWGEVERIDYPAEYHKWREMNDADKFKVELDVEGVDNLKWLLLLCRHVNLDPKPLCSLPKPETILEADDLCNRQVLQFYLSEFKASSWDGAPLTKAEIITMVERLLLGC